MMAIKVVTSLEELVALRPDWQILFASSDNHTPFQSWEWHYAWWKHFGRPGALRILVAESRGKVLGIAPLCLSSTFRGWPLKHLTFISRKRSDYLDFLVQPGAETEFFTELFAFIKARRADWRFVDLSDLPQSSANMLAVLIAAGRTFRCLTVEAREVCVVIPIPPSWDAFLAGLSKKMRSNVGRSIRALEGQFAIELKASTGVEQTLEDLTEFARMHTERWKQEQGSTYFEQPGNLDFEREFCSLATQAGWYRLYTLYANGKPIAGSLGYVSNHRYYAALLAKLPELDRYSAGTFLMSQLIQQCMQNGWTSLDLTRGDEHYKHRWNGVETRNLHVRIFATRLGLVQVAILDGLYRFATEVRVLHRIRAALRRLKVSKPISELSHSAHTNA